MASTLNIPRKSYFYTYIYFRDDGTPYYIGKGKDNRCYQKYSKFVPVPDRARILVEHWYSEEKALEMEKWYINLFGRKDNRTGILRNLTDGGEGVSGYKHTEESNKKNRESHIGKPSGRKGKFLSEESKEKIRMAKLGKKTGKMNWVPTQEQLERRRLSGLKGASSRWGKKYE